MKAKVKRLEPPARTFPWGVYVKGRKKWHLYTTFESQSKAIQFAVLMGWELP